MASYSSSDEDTFFETGQEMGTPEEGGDVGAMSLHDTWDGTMTDDECAWPMAQKNEGTHKPEAWWPLLPSL